MESKVPVWACGKFKCVPSKRTVGAWNVSEKYWYGWRRWTYHTGGHYRGIKEYLSLDHAKEAIDKEIAEVEKYAAEKIKIKEWRKTKPVDHP